MWGSLFHIWQERFLENWNVEFLHCTAHILALDLGNDRESVSSRQGSYQTWLGCVAQIPDHTPFWKDLHFCRMVQIEQNKWKLPYKFDFLHFLKTLFCIKEPLHILKKFSSLQFFERTCRNNIQEPMSGSITSVTKMRAEVRNTPIFRILEHFSTESHTRFYTSHLSKN